MKNFFSMLTLVIATIFATPAFAGFGGFNNTQNLGVFTWLKCSTGLTCTKQGPYMVATVTGASGAVTVPREVNWPTPTLTSGTAVNGASGTIYVTSIKTRANATLTGVAVNNASVSGATNYIVALFNSAGVQVAQSSASGTATSGSSAWQQVPFTAPYTVSGPATYYVGLEVSNGSDSFYTVPAVGAYMGYGSALTRAYGASAAITVPAAFTNGVAPVVYIY